jgi:hypothetical protein
MSKQIEIEDEALKALARTYRIDTDASDWLRTLALCLAVEHRSGFYKSIGGGPLSIIASLIGGKALLIPPRPRGAPSKQYRQHAREDAVLQAATEIRERSANISLRRACALLRKNGFVLPKEKRPLSEKMLYEFATRSNTRRRRNSRNAMAKALLGIMTPPVSTALSTLGSPKKSE